MIVRCVKCQEDFVPEGVFSIWDGDVEVQYFSCTVCGARYQVMTSNPEMRSLMARRNTLVNELGIARNRKWPEKTQRKIRQRLDKVYARQMKILPALKKRGEEILEGDTNERGQGQE